ncbi:MAG TPA: hypothetical protein VF192_11335 [Longimicrobiales bacterium]
MSLVSLLARGRLPTRRPFLSCALCCALAACEAPPVPERTPILELGAIAARLPAGTRIHDVRVGSAAPAPELDPDTLRVRPGDVVRFTASATGTHAIAFDASALAPEQGAFLSRTHQLRGPPLFKAGAAWVVSLAGAPPGAYPFLCLTHGARGVLHVVP